MMDSPTGNVSGGLLIVVMMLFDLELEAEDIDIGGLTERNS